MPTLVCCNCSQIILWNILFIKIITVICNKFFNRIQLRINQPIQNELLSSICSGIKSWWLFFLDCLQKKFNLESDLIIFFIVNQCREKRLQARAMYYIISVLTVYFFSFLFHFDIFYEYKLWIKSTCLFLVWINTPNMSLLRIVNKLSL